MCVALAALEAKVHVTGSSGERTIALEDFHRLPGDTPHLDNNLRPDEIITAIELPAKGFAAHHSYLKIRDRLSYAFALVSVAAALEIDGGQHQGGASRAWRCRAQAVAQAVMRRPRCAVWRRTRQRLRERPISC